MQTLFTKINTHAQKAAVDKPLQVHPLSIGASKRRAGWKPQPSGLTRDETREFVLEMIG